MKVALTDFTSFELNVMIEAASSSMLEKHAYVQSLENYELNEAPGFYEKYENANNELAAIRLWITQLLNAKNTVNSREIVMSN